MADSVAWIAGEPGGGTLRLIDMNAAARPLVDIQSMGVCCATGSTFIAHVDRDDDRIRPEQVDGVVCDVAVVDHDAGRITVLRENEVFTASGGFDAHGRLACLVHDMDDSSQLFVVDGSVVLQDRPLSFRPGYSVIIFVDGDVMYAVDQHSSVAWSISDDRLVGTGPGLGTGRGSLTSCPDGFVVATNTDARLVRPSLLPPAV